MPGFTNAKHGRGDRYAAAHQRERRRLKPSVDRGEAYCQQGFNGSSGTCLMPTRWIEPGTPWVLGHDDAGTGWIGPVHERCNQHDGASRGGHAASRARHGAAVPFGTWRTSRTW